MNVGNSHQFNALKQYGNAPENMLFLGENLHILNLIKHEYANKMQCIYLDPPYNSCNPFDMFNDCVAPSKWKKIMRARLSVLWEFLNETGSIWMSIDDSEFANLKVLCDELWGRDHFILCIVRQKNRYPGSTDRPIVHMHDYILVYAKDPDKVKIHGVPSNNSDNGFTIENLLVWKKSIGVLSDKSEYYYDIKLPDGSIVVPPEGRCWRVPYDQYLELYKQDMIWFDKESVYPYIKHKVENNSLVRPTSLWAENDVGSNQIARYEIRKYDTGSFFYVPKPEKLLYRILSISTDVGDWVLDPYLGSGTTAAVALKMGRKWIGIEQGEKQVRNICVPRLEDVIKGKDEGEIAKKINWSGGGGFTLLESQ